MSRAETVRKLRATDPPTPWKKIAAELGIHLRTLTKYTKAELDLMMCHGILRTHEVWRKIGAMK